MTTSPFSENQPAGPHRKPVDTRDSQVTASTAGLSAEDRLLLDQLVDGELSRWQQKLLLARLEESPDGWRSCALAFLEAQAWQGEFADLLKDPADNTQTAGTPAAPSLTPSLIEKPRPQELASGDNPEVIHSRGSSQHSHPHVGRSPVLSWLATAASLVIAFSLGWSSGPWFQNAGRSGPPTFSTEELAEKDDSEGHQQSAPGQRSPNNRLVKGGAAPTQASGSAPSAARQYYELTLPTLGVAEPVRVPVVEGIGLAGYEQWLLHPQPHLPEGLRAEFRRFGLQAREQRSLLRLQLEDGGEIFVPYYQLQVQPQAPLPMQ